VGNAEKSACAASVRAAARLIQRSGRTIICDEITAKLAGLKCAVVPDAARQIAGSKTPMLGVNIGGLGFLTAVPSDKLAEALKCVWRGEFKFESRALIEATGNGRGKKIKALALNDIVVSRGAVSRLIALDVSVNGEPITRYRCDGLIVSSPTGSTAYSLAAGGAIVLPTAEVFVLTPICPHALSNRSIILPLSATIRVKPVSTSADAFLNADGQIVGELDAGDEVTIRRSQSTVRLVHLKNSSFLEALRRKLHWRGTYF